MPEDEVEGPLESAEGRINPDADAQKAKPIRVPPLRQGESTRRLFRQAGASLPEDAPPAPEKPADSYRPAPAGGGTEPSPAAPAESPASDTGIMAREFEKALTEGTPAPVAPPADSYKPAAEAPAAVSAPIVDPRVELVGLGGGTEPSPAAPAEPPSPEDSDPLVREIQRTLAGGGTQTPAPIRELRGQVEKATRAVENLAAQALEGAAGAHEANLRAQRDAEEAEAAKDRAADAAAAAGEVVRGLEAGEPAEMPVDRMVEEGEGRREAIREKYGLPAAGEQGTIEAGADAHAEAEAAEAREEAPAEPAARPVTASETLRSEAKRQTDRREYLGGISLRGKEPTAPKKKGGLRKLIFGEGLFGKTARIGLLGAAIAAVAFKDDLEELVRSFNEPSQPSTSYIPPTYTPPRTTTAPTGPTTTATTPPPTYTPPATAQAPTTAPTTTPTGPTTTQAPTTATTPSTTTTPTTQTPTTPENPTTTQAPTTPTPPTTTTAPTEVKPTEPKYVTLTYEASLPKFEPDEPAVRRLAKAYMDSFVAYEALQGNQVAGIPEVRNRQYRILAGENGVLELEELLGAIETHEGNVRQLRQETGKEHKNLDIVVKNETDPEKVQVTVRLTEELAERLKGLGTKYGPAASVVVAALRVYSQEIPNSTERLITEENVKTIEQILTRLYGDNK